MKKPTDEEILVNFEKIETIIEKLISGDRQDKLKKLFSDLGERFAIAPASGTNYFHCAFPGGLVVHTLNVIKFAIKIYDLWAENGANVSGYNKSDLIFCALVHDLGKIGNHSEDMYIMNGSDRRWYIENRGEIYMQNPNIPYFKHADRTIWMLNQYGITLTENEFIAISCHDGMFEESNKPYLTQYSEDKLPKCNLVFILGQADFMAFRIEQEQFLMNKNKKETKEEKKDKLKELEEKFDVLF